MEGGMTPSELHELAEAQLAEMAELCDCGGCECARGLLSALDALQKRDHDLEAAIKVIWKWHRKKQAAEASRDQAIKERDRWKQEAREWADASLENRDEADRLAEALRTAQHWHEQLDFDEALNVIDIALAGVPGGSPEEEHNPGTTAAQSSVVGSDEA